MDDAAKIVARALDECDAPTHIATLAVVDALQSAGLLRDPPRDANARAVMDRVRERATKGLEEYGVTTEGAGLSPLEWLQHLQDELLDGAVYIEALKGADLRAMIAAAEGEG